MALLKVHYEKLPYQAEFHDATDPNVILSAGYGAGKTYSLAMKGLRLMNVNRNVPGGLLCPNFKMFRRDVLPTFKDICRENGIPYRYRKMDQILEFPITGTELLIFHSEDDGLSIKGPNLGWGLINEVTLCTRGAFDAFLSRMRLKTSKLLQIAMSGTPEGFNWFYDDFISKPRQDTRIIFGDMRLNRHVAEGYAKRLSETYDELSRQMYVEGKFVNLNGRAAVHAFSRAKHCRPVQRIEGAEVWVAVDFNVNPMAAGFYNPVRVENGRTLLRGFGELKLQNADTPQLGNAIIQALGGTQGVTIFPDPAGKARATRSHRSDIMLLEDAGFQDMRYKSRTSTVRDAINATNAMFEKGLVEIDPEKMPETVRDLEQVVWKDGVFELDKSKQDRTHWLDGLKNMIDFEFPIGEGRGGWREQAR